MGNPDLEMHSPARDPHRRRSRAAVALRDAASLCAAVAAGILLAVGLWSLCDLAASRSRLSLQIPCLANPVHAIGSGGGGGSYGSGSSRSSSSSSSSDAQKAVTEQCTHASCMEGSGGGVALIEVDELRQRRDALAQVLMDEAVDGFVAEPGSAFTYYTNISQADWDIFSPSPHPFLLVIQPVLHPDGSVAAKTTLFLPRQQADHARALLLLMRPPHSSSSSSLAVLSWTPYWDPYATLRRSRLFAPTDPLAVDAERRPVLMTDPATRALVVDGLEDAGFRYRRLAPAVGRLMKAAVPLGGGASGDDGSSDRWRGVRRSVQYRRAAPW
ncbi:hypothetical protein BBO_00581 [Beauveria brongniartii RCEF 3172]|uniref:Uncharacterized protein n=1 Tax=Beauveria brongniartii RCEF 3172 TaxID=1081107 RepID=A0A162M940_9HYPO|nr:hypothetical protein BBO_00581 [Beauveria brongniartii RCEF 3172]